MENLDLYRVRISVFWFFMAVSMSVAMMTALIMQGVIGDLSLKLERKIKDAILMIVLGIAFFLNIITINLSHPIIDELVILGCIILGVGAFFYILSIFTLHRKDTSKIVDNGIYGIIRHPMYLGMASVLLGMAVIHGTIITFLFSILFMIIMELLFIPFEEENLETIFGNKYLDYKKKIRRWM